MHTRLVYPNHYADGSNNPYRLPIISSNIGACSSSTAAISYGIDPVARATGSILWDNITTPLFAYSVPVVTTLDMVSYSSARCRAMRLPRNGNRNGHDEKFKTQLVGRVADEPQGEWTRSSMRSGDIMLGWRDSFGRPFGLPSRLACVFFGWTDIQHVIFPCRWLLSRNRWNVRRNSYQIMQLLCDEGTIMPHTPTHPTCVELHAAHLNSNYFIDIIRVECFNDWE